MNENKGFVTLHEAFMLICSRRRCKARLAVCNQGQGPLILAMHGERESRNRRSRSPPPVDRSPARAVSVAFAVRRTLIRNVREGILASIVRVRGLRHELDGLRRRELPPRRRQRARRRRRRQSVPVRQSIE